MGNPYDRRQGPRRDRFADGMTNLGVMGFAEPQFHPARSTLTLADLDGLAGAVAQRVEHDTEKRMRREADEQAQQHRREAWDEGHAEGARGERGRLLVQIDEEFGARAADLGRDITALLEREENPKRDELAHYLGEASQLLTELVRRHHAGFAPTSG